VNIIPKKKIQEENFKKAERLKHDILLPGNIIGNPDVHCVCHAY